MKSDERRQILQVLPKTDLHRHLEGSLRIDTLLELGRCRGLDLPLGSRDELAPLVTFCDGEPRTLAHFLTKFRADWYHTYADVERVAREAVQDAAREGVIYLELRLSPEHFTRHSGLKVPGVIQAAAEAARATAAEEGLTIRLLLTFARERYHQGDWSYILDQAVRFHHLGVAGVDLAGDEFGHPNQKFAAFFDRVRDTGVLGATVHAGEGTSAESVVTAVELLGAARIGHGVSAVEDERAARLLAERGVTLEMCPISNYQTGCVNDLSRHPLPRLQELSVPVTINSDDPCIHQADLTDNYDIAVSRWGYGLGELLRLELGAIDCAFLEEEEKQQLRRRIEEGYGRASNLGL